MTHFPLLLFLTGHTNSLAFHFLQQPSSSKGGMPEHMTKKRSQDVMWSEYMVCLGDIRLVCVNCIRVLAVASVISSLLTLHLEFNYFIFLKLFGS